ncbi:DUF4382 domain-containing protein [Sphingobacterium cellulitidis]|uniref:Lipoprotein n=1 Tax=Sphingobacterium cellulitidis TaxID=1768011 RepID=A0A8H9KZ43_9SPHI|nr:DUF4382 domain-containing protein [Sphingobacterium soli]MBA8988342.1 hypothetical protein [Sphingobacterium soli]OYD42462.1 hypothetical protein CHT99_06425 [Sphingobacterium cellulitidis]GGE32010.1 lipoprotein [Sphingobacterium soli]
MKALLGLAVAAVALSLSSCSTDNSNTTDGKTPLTIKITDAPAYYDQILLDIDHIEVITEGGREVIDIDIEPFDILSYREGDYLILAEHDVPSGRLQEIRLVLDDDNEIVVDGVKHHLTTPSGQSSGVKIKVQDDLVPHVAYTLALDFDASKSIHQTGNGKYMLKPVIRAIPVALSGAITGSINPIFAMPHVYAIQGTDTLGTLASPTGKFYFPGVPQGTYKILIEPTNTNFLPKTLENVNVSIGQTKDLGEIVVENK